MRDLYASVSSQALLCISPIDGRYAEKTEKLRGIASEFGLILYRLTVMVEIFIALSDDEDTPLRAFTRTERRRLRKIVANFSLADAQEIKAIEMSNWGPFMRTNHDVKAIELWLRYKLGKTTLKDCLEWIHFGCTSEDVNNMAYGLMLRDMVTETMVPELDKIMSALKTFAGVNKYVAMLAETHGQAATPTTLGKEFAVFVSRLRRQIGKLKNFRLSVKLNSASGNMNAMYAACPEVDWQAFSSRFIARLGKRASYRFEQTEISTQIESHDTYAELFDIIKRILTILIGFSQDVWSYISGETIVQRPKEGEAGSSIMPHKVNPIDFENAEGNLGIAYAIMEFFCRKLPISRRQRDLSDSTVERAFGMSFAHCIVAFKSIVKGMEKIYANEEHIRQELIDHPEVLTEAIQTILRRINYPNAYDALKQLARGKKITLEEIDIFIEGLNPELVDRTTKDWLKRLTPQSYIGIAPELTEKVLAVAD